MGKKLAIALLAGAMTWMFPGIGQAALMYATHAAGPDAGHLTEPLGSPGWNLAEFTRGDLANVVFHSGLNDGFWADSAVAIRRSDLSLLIHLGLGEHRADPFRYSGGRTSGAPAVDVNDQATPVPEPGTMILLGVGLVGLAGWGRKRFGK